MFRLLQMMYGFQMLNADGLKWYVDKGTISQAQYQQIVEIGFNKNTVNVQAPANSQGSVNTQSASSSTSASGQPTNIQQ